MNIVDDKILSGYCDKVTPENIWGRYNHVYDWSYDATNCKVSTFALSDIHWERTAAIILRDYSIAEKLRQIGVKKILDVGSDTGHLLAVLTSYGIQAVGVDSSRAACDFINQKNVNRCYNLSIKDLIKIDKLNIGYDCLVCLNITHAKWADEQLKMDFINWGAKHFKYLLLSDFTNQEKRWSNLDLIHRFNLGRFKYNYYIQLICRILGIDVIPHYLGIQRLFKSKIKINY